MHKAGTTRTAPEGPPQRVVRPAGSATPSQRRPCGCRARQAERGLAFWSGAHGKPRCASTRWPPRRRGRHTTPPWSRRFAAGRGGELLTASLFPRDQRGDAVNTIAPIARRHLAPERDICHVARVVRRSGRPKYMFALARKRCQSCILIPALGAADGPRPGTYRLFSSYPDPGVVEAPPRDVALAGWATARARARR